MSYTDDQLNRLVDELRALPREAEWVEFKMNNADPKTLGANMSAVSNSAALHDKEKAYIIWGVNAETHEILGTTFSPKAEKIGNEELENWLSQMLDPRINFTIYEHEYVPGTSVSVFEIDAAITYPVSFQHVPYIRIGTYTKKLSDNRGKEKALWAKLQKTMFEDGTAKADVTKDEVLSLLDYKTLFNRLEIPTPSTTAGIIEKLIEEEIVIPGKERYSITNLGAILFANNLKDFDTVARKALRVVLYKGDDKSETQHEQRGGKGYAVGVDNIVQYVLNYSGG